MLTKKPSSLPKVVTKHSKEKDENMGMKVEEVFGLLDFDLDGKIAVSELRDAILACGVPIEKEEAAALGDHFTQVSGGLVDLKAFKQILRDHRPTYTNAEKYFTGLLQDIKIDENGMIDPNYMRVVFKNVGQKIGEINVDMFLKGLKKEENGKIKIETIAKRLATLNPL